MLHALTFKNGSTNLREPGSADIHRSQGAKEDEKIRMKKNKIQTERKLAKTKCLYIFKQWDGRQGVQYRQTGVQYF